MRRAVSSSTLRLAPGEMFAYLVEADVLGLLTEALTAQVEVVLADETGGVLADTAVKKEGESQHFILAPELSSRLSMLLSPEIEIEWGEWDNLRTSCESPCPWTGGIMSRDKASTIDKNTGALGKPPPCWMVAEEQGVELL
ncbi:hypothetical protein CSUB01_00200 [Colletotrichum sublineola]|uniref:Uncharacterized protein n=1 Tax=Colletotrichum sublineola TaxID=1173701 RepID=A0A066XBL2_COLSU|nr:hypothetical protein CSUB01_00200 [Colletotrichum sublineola]